MNLVEGKLVNAACARKMLEVLRERIATTLEKPPLQTELVLFACDTLARAVGEEHVKWLMAAGLPAQKSREYICAAKEMLCRETLEHRLRVELGEEHAGLRRMEFCRDTVVTERLFPLGALLHIMAGNQYGLAFYSVIEGLLTGNVNIVKLPSGDDGLTAMIFMELFRIEPRLIEYVYVFDFPSSDQSALMRMMDAANAVTVWGGDEAIRAVRMLAGPEIKVIEWGHKLSFAYAVPGGVGDAALRGLAQNMIQTNQLLCSSCQGIFVDTENMEEVYRFCERFLPILCAGSRESRGRLEDGVRAQTALRVYDETLEMIYRPCRVFGEKDVSVIAYEDNALTTAIGFGNCWVRPLARKEMQRALHPHKNHLQTAALLCTQEERELLAERLFACGVVRVTDAEHMSATYPGAAHDGEYPLRKYVRTTSIEMRKDD